MNIEKISPGRIVKSKCGRDRGSFYVIITVSECKKFVFIADGRIRKLSALKKKNILHLEFLNESIELLNITDKKLRAELFSRNFLGESSNSVEV